MPVEIVRRGVGRKYRSRAFKKIALAVLDIAGQKAAELSLALIGNGEMQKLNARYRGKDYPTDVLSFPAGVGLPVAAPLLGDVIISVEKAAEQAKERRHPLDYEMVTLLIHGVVHLLGYDHERSAKEARLMKRLEQRIYRQLCERGLIRL
ncbi:MAG: rRNA maturation RNase YbeY [Chloroflexota bacterium]